MSREIEEFLKTAGLSRYIGAFDKANADLDALFRLSLADLSDLGVEPDDQVRLLTALRKFQSSKNVVEHRLLSLIFVDLVGSTEMSVRMDVEEYRAVVSEYQNVCETAILSQGGHLGRKFGDGILAYFGFPESRETDVLRCAQAAIDILQKVPDVQKTSDISNLMVRIGIATGMTLVDESTQQVGAENGQVFGHTPNLAARLQNVAEPNSAIVCEKTRELIGGHFKVSDQGFHALKGISQKVRAWKLVDRSETLSRFHGRLLSSGKTLLGRELEKQIIVDCWDAARKGEARYLTIDGCAGIGKSMLVWDAVEKLAGEAAQDLHLQCEHDHRTKPFHPISVALDRGVRSVAHEYGVSYDSAKDIWVSLNVPNYDDASQVLSNILLHNAELSHNKTISLSERQSIFEFLQIYLEQLQTNNPLLIVVEDLHWIDPTTREFLEDLVKKVDGWRVLILCTQREDIGLKLADRINEIRIDLDPLDRDTAKSLLEQEIRDIELPLSVRNDILMNSEGIPLYLEEFARAAVDRQHLELAGNDLQNGRSRPSNSDVKLPVSLMAPLLSRLDIRKGSREVLSAAAAIGRRFSPDTLATLLNQANDHVTAILDEMVIANILTRHGRQLGQYEFAHAVMQEASYEILLKRDRLPLHRRIADLLIEYAQSNKSGQNAGIAHHLSSGEVWPEAKAYWIKAAGEMQQISAQREAVVYLKRALEANENCEDGDTRLADEITIREKIFASLEASDWWSAEIAENLEKIEALRAKRGDATESLMFINGVAGDHLLAGRLTKAKDLGHRMLSMHNAEEEVAQILGNRVIGICEFFSGNYDKAIPRFRVSVDLAASIKKERVKDYYFADVALIMNIFSIWARVLLGSDEAVDTDLRVALEEAHDAPDKISRLYALCLIGCIYQQLNVPASALEVSTTALEKAREIDQTYWIGWASVLAGWSKGRLGETRAGLEELDLGIALYTSTGTTQFLQYALALRCDALLSDGRLEAAAEAISKLQKTSGDHEMRYTDPIVAKCLTRLTQLQ